MSQIEGFDAVAAADLVGTDVLYVRRVAQPAGSRDAKLTFPALIRGLWAAATIPLARVQLGFITATATLDFGSIATTATADLTITVTGAAVGDAVILGLPAAPAAGIVFFAFVSAADTVKVRAMNITGLSVDPASATYRATVIKSA